ncbi:hypothetical protein Plhal304r1_c038g0115421 [Plasmopara halstedii]
MCERHVLETITGVGEHVRHWSVDQRAVVVMITTFFIPYSRETIVDRTVIQIAVGSTNGIILGITPLC